MILSRKSPNFSQHEVRRLIDVVESFHEIIESKKTDSATWRDKSKAWREVSDIYNAMVPTPRTAEQLRIKYDSLKKEARKALARAIAEREEAIRSGCEPVGKSISPVHERLCSLIGIAVDGLNNTFDTNFMTFCQPIERTEENGLDNGNCSRTSASGMAAIGSSSPLTSEDSHQPCSSRDGMTENVTPLALEAPQIRSNEDGASSQRRKRPKISESREATRCFTALAEAKTELARLQIEALEGKLKFQRQKQDLQLMLLRAELDGKELDNQLKRVELENKRNKKI
ncbi:uncharacterized protein LOC124165962 [Ischnura elegans]|uniref:uncharacterized protein LOC124165962 n=1 Tax=Ischnura elegans TaxID=197161 RepID=UPI001ED8AB04|nr:uncharacterized protein LOC124165962 [Ischnura elegans]XP_046399466.1 uncharacterized protein LOC124165962 [Ischnura elegans]XP_046399467.1 uncharacterized protein LOC124165962 [Ischnura elegans]